MKYLSKLITVITICLSALPALAQENATRQIYAQAESEYTIGRVEQAIDILQEHIGEFKGNVQESAFRLMAICWLSLDDNQKAEEWTRNLLSQSPYYTASSQDPQRFIDMVERIKSGLTAKITTASSQEESLAEVPVPTTLITEEMIHNCGARNLQEVLAAYVPGMNIVDCNEDINIAMRGIYSNSQEKILILLNGHRLNSYMTNTAAPDFSISLDKLRQIEVLRGPASSLYGGVALTAVVNLITKQGADVDGISVKAAAGDHGVLHGDILFGKRYFDLDLLMWGSLHKSNGEEKASYSRENGNYEGNVTIGRIGDKPSYDFGIQLNWKELQLLYDTRFSQIVAPYTLTTLAMLYDHDRYRTYNGISPSYATYSHHADLSYHKSFGKLSMNAAVTFDKADVTYYQVISDEPIKGSGASLSLPQEVVDIFENNQGLSRYINGQEQTYGAQLKGTFKYIDNSSHKGSLSFGADFSHFKLTDMSYLLGYNFVETMFGSNQFHEFGKGHENSSDVYLQLKHRWKSLIFNAGLRYDHKHRYDGSNANEFSPRIAVIFLRPKWNVKMSYSRSFVDAPYLYRKTNDFLLMMKNVHEYRVMLDPEYVNSLQLTFSSIDWVKGLNFGINAFYNHARNLIMTRIIDYTNAGRNKTFGIELMAKYQSPKFTANLTASWINTFKMNLMNLDDEVSLYQMYNSDIDDNNNTPKIAAHAVVSWKPTERLKFFCHTLFEGKQTSYNTDFNKSIEIYNFFNEHIKTLEDLNVWGDELFAMYSNYILKEEIDAHIVCIAGAEYQISKRLTVGFNIHNLFNTRFYRSGVNTRTIPQKGRWSMATITYKF